MASVALDPAYRRVGIAEFLSMDFGGAKAELDDGLIYMMAGGDSAHARTASNIIFLLRSLLRGSGCFPFGSDLAVRTGTRSIRYPDVSVYCDAPTDRDRDRDKLLGDPRVVFEVLSSSTAKHDQNVKLAEYQALSGLRAIVFADPRDESLRLLARADEGVWREELIKPNGGLQLPVLGITLSGGEIFARV